MAVVMTVLASLFVSLTIIPWLSSLLLAEHEPAQGNAVLRAFNRAIHATYAPLLDRALRRPAGTIVLAAAMWRARGARAGGRVLFVPRPRRRSSVDITAPRNQTSPSPVRRRGSPSGSSAAPGVSAIYTSVGRY
jgi:multidrug efflux pump subunit AcrB